MCFNDGAGEREPEAQPVSLSRRERHRSAVDEVGIKSGPVVPHANDNRVCALAFRLDRDLAVVAAGISQSFCRIAH